MRPPDEERSALEHEMLEAEHALAGRRFDAAQHHAEEAARLGAHGHDVVRLEKAIASARRTQDQRGRSSGFVGFLIAAVGYLILATQQPPAWRVPVWAAMSLLVVPALAGFVVGRRLGAGRSRGRRFWGALRPVGFAMFLYTAISLAVLRSRMGTGAGGQVFLVILFAAAAYGIVAGVVAGMVSGVLTVRGPKEVAL